MSGRERDGVCRGCRDGGDGWIEGWMSGRERDGVCRGCRDGGDGWIEDG